MAPLLLFISLTMLIVVLFEIRERRRARTQQSPDNQKSDFAPSSDNTRPEGCCGEHLVCERETLLQTNAQIEYYDDEELDALAGIAAEDYTPEQHEMVRAVFTTLQESDVPGWCPEKYRPAGRYTRRSIINRSGTKEDSLNAPRRILRP